MTEIHFELNNGKYGIVSYDGIDFYELVRLITITCQMEKGTIDLCYILDGEVIVIVYDCFQSSEATYTSNLTAWASYKMRKLHAVESNPCVEFSQEYTNTIMKSYNKAFIDYMNGSKR